MKFFLEEHSRIRKVLPYLVILCIALLTEVFVFNFSTWKTIGLEPIELASQVETDQSGTFQTEYIEIGENVSNINVEMEMENCETAVVEVYLTDEGDKYEYGMSPITIANQVQSSQYTNLYPFGKVNTMQVTVTVPEGAVGIIDSIMVNVHRPFSFHILRFLTLFLVLLISYSVCARSYLHDVICNEKSIPQKLIILGVIVALVLLGKVLCGSNPLCVSSPWPHHHQYQELAYELKEGNVALPFEPSEGLKQAENPYDTISLMAEGVEYRMDYAYHNGKYYVYFGIVPELLFYLPYYSITGQDLPNYKVMMFLYAGLVLGIFGFLWELIYYEKWKVPFFYYLLIAVGLSLSANYVYLAARPDLYNIPIMAGNCFTMLGLFLWIAGLRHDRGKGLYYFAGSFCMAMVAGCRPQMLLFSLIGLVLFLPEIVQKRTLFSRKTWLNTLLLCLPYFMVGAVVFWYNLARFGSGFDFGATYSLTSNDMNHRGFNLSRVLQGMFNFFIQPANLTSGFPFINGIDPTGPYMGRNITEFTFGSVFSQNAILCGLFLVFFAWKSRMNQKHKYLLSCFCGVSLIIAVFDINGAGIIQRYMSDMVLGLLLAAAMLWFLMLDQTKQGAHEYAMGRICWFVVLTGICFSFFMLFAKGDSVCIQENAPEIFYRVMGYFKF